ncbi:DUF5392 family protein [Radiobacillus sp. PE A8.2]|uniref:DUF5392 family protein n=1 Tax=Radiobacillus sp. PE A8.2 TaxID=3380349 RepID=UPI00388D2E9D
MPKNFQKEMSKIQELVAPVAKKRSRYMFMAFPLLFISLFNLFTLLLFSTWNQDTIIMAIVYGFFGAIGLALSKESKYQNKQIKQISNNYMTKRVGNSTYLSEYRKQEYIALINEHPLLAINNFIKFLSEEENSVQHQDIFK